MDKEIKEESKWINELENALENYDKTFLVWDQGNQEERDKLWKLIQALCDQEAIHCAEKKCLVLFSREEYRALIPENSPVTCRLITEEKARFYYRLYHLYEFSHRFSVISKSAMYGSLFDLMDTGLLDKQEAAEVLLH